MYSPLPELGMDSISGLEVKQTLEQRYDLFLSPRDLMSLTFATLDEIQKTGKKSRYAYTLYRFSTTYLPILIVYFVGTIVKKNDTNVMAIVPYLRNVLSNKAEKTALFESAILVELPSILTETATTTTTQTQPNSRSHRTIFCFPSIDGNLSNHSRL